MKRRGTVRQAFRGGILTRFTIVFIGTILVPSLGILAYSIVSAARETRASIMLTSESVAADLYESIATTISAGSDLAERLAFDASALREYLDLPFVESGDSYLEFTNETRPILQYAAQFKGSIIDGARVVTADPSQPEAWPFFVSEARMRELEWFRDFLDSDAEATWHIPNEGGVYSRYNPPSIQIIRRPVFTHARKIRNLRSEYIGTALVDVLQSAVRTEMDALTVPSMDFILATLDETYWHESTAAESPLSAEERAAWLAAIKADLSLDNRELEPGSTPDRGSRVRVTTGHDGRYTYFWGIVEGPGLVSSARVDLRTLIVSETAASVLVGAVIVLGVIALEIVTYLMLNGLFRRLTAMTQIMGKVAGGEFDHRIPVEQDDEIGEIAEDFNVLIGRINELVTDSVRRETLQKDTELKALQFQINPHFIYNTIDAFRMRLLLAGNDELADSLADFGKLIRYNVAGDSLFAALSDEIDVVTRYVNLQRLRYEDRLALTVDIDPHGELRVPRFLLQPIVENSIRHGMPDDGSTLSISISAHRVNGTALITVHDDGRGIPPARMAELERFLSPDRTVMEVDGENGIGLTNIVGRLDLFYSGDARLEIDSAEGEFAQVTVRLPVRDDQESQP